MKFVFLLCLIASLHSFAQPTTKQFTVEGEITAAVTVDWDKLKTYKTVSLDSQTIYNHLMERKGVIKNIKGVLLRDVLAGIEFKEKSPKKLSEFYLVCTASDGYKVVFSWNELFNGPTGDKAMIITQKNGAAAEMQDDGIALLTPSDKASGRRFVKGLSKIVVLRVN